MRRLENLNERAAHSATRDARGIARDRSYKIPEKGSTRSWKVGDEVNARTDAGWENGTVIKIEPGEGGILVEFPDGESDWFYAEDLYPPGKFKHEEASLGERVRLLVFTEIEEFDSEAEAQAAVKFLKKHRIDSYERHGALLVDKEREVEARRLLDDRGAKGEMTERPAPLGERRTETDEKIEHEIGEWLERGEEFELDDINERIGRLGELKVLANNIDHIVHRELKKAIGAGVPSSIVSEIDQSSLNSEGIGGDYRATGKFRIWHDQDAYAQGSFSAEGMAGELQNMTINITQASGHGKRNPPLRFF